MTARTKFPTMQDLRNLDPSVRISNRPYRFVPTSAQWCTLSVPRWELKIKDKRVTGPLDGQFFHERKDAELRALQLLQVQS